MKSGSYFYYLLTKSNAWKTDQAIHDLLTLAARERFFKKVDFSKVSFYLDTQIFR